MSDRQQFTPTSVRLPKRMAAKLEEYAAANGTSKSVMIVRMLAQGLGMPEYVAWKESEEKDK